jgi:putative PEP-CTERM system histidine kinase
MIQLIEGAAFLCGLAIAALLIISPRFGRGSRRLLLLVLPACFSAALHAVGTEITGLSAHDSFKLSFALVIFTAAGGYLAAYHLNRKTKWVLAIPVLMLTVLLVSLLYLMAPADAEGLKEPDGYIALGPIAYVSALFLLIISVIVIATLEQILRDASETVRWELKFLFLAIGALYAAIIYISSQVLLFLPRTGWDLTGAISLFHFPRRNGLVLTGAISLFHCIFLISCILIGIAWRRGSGRSHITVSHSAVYSSITLLSVGVYLIASSLIARWVTRWGEISLPTEALIFLLSAVAFVSLILGTGFRHRTRAWIRRNIFAGAYDYRQFWLESTERVRSIDPPAATAAALADIIHRAIGAIDVSVWVRRWNPNRLLLLSALGTISDSLEKEATGVLEELLKVSDPISRDDLDKMQDVEQTKIFAAKTRASLLVPLLSSNRIVGVITAGADRSGRPYNWEASEFLRALAGHAAGEFHKSDLLATLVEAKEDEAFRAFSTFVLHDLKNFASTLSYIAQNAPRHQQNPEFQKDAFQSVYDTAEKMKRLCSSLRTFSGALAADKKLTDLNQVVRSVADSFSTAISKQIKLELGDLQPVFVDPEEVKRVIQNLLLNACEAITEDGIIIVKTVDLEKAIEVSVQDNGKGMRRDFIEKELFLPFHTTKSGGLGIGLFQSKKIIEAHQGSILVESEEGKGTKVSLMFPAVSSPQVAQK